MIFITGGTGLVGSHILLKLSQDNIPFKSLKREESSLQICKEVFTHYNSSELFDAINWVNGDINDIPSLEEGMQTCDKLIHAAAIVSFKKEDSELLQKVNVEGTENVMNVALSSSIKKVAYISSIATLGRTSTTDIVNEDCMFQLSDKESDYAISKYHAEQEVWRSSQEGLDVVILNPSVILGPGDWTKGSSQIFEKIYKKLKFYTPGSTGYVDVIDVANCAVKLLNSDIINERFIINGENLKYKQLFDWISDGFNVKKPTILVTPFLKEIAWRVEWLKSLITGKSALITKETADFAMRDSYYSTSKIEDSIAYKFTPIKKSIKKYCVWFLSRV
jgi:nucleoside-diphosphate-sugar epimerase